MEKEFTNKVALVTGGAMGIGKAVALLLAEKGAKVVIIDKAKDEAAKVVKEITGDAIAIQADVSKSSDVKNTIEETVKNLERSILYPTTQASRDMALLNQLPKTNGMK